MLTPFQTWLHSIDISNHKNQSKNYNKSISNMIYLIELSIISFQSLDHLFKYNIRFFSGWTTYVKYAFTGLYASLLLRKLFVFIRCDRIEIRANIDFKCSCPFFNFINMRTSHRVLSTQVTSLWILSSIKSISKWTIVYSFVFEVIW